MTKQPYYAICTWSDTPVQYLGEFENHEQAHDEARTRFEDAYERDAVYTEQEYETLFRSVNSGSKSVTVIFGEEAVKKFVWEFDEEFSEEFERQLEEEDWGSILTNEFDTEAERQAYLQGIDDAQGWLDVCVVENKS